MSPQIRVGASVIRDGKEYFITSVGKQTVRLERGHGIHKSVLVVPIIELLGL